MRKIIKNNTGVSNILAYLFSITLITIVTASSILYTNILIEDKTEDIAGQNAQVVANKVGYIINEALTNIRSNSNSYYNKTTEIPQKLAGLDYYIEIANNVVYVNNTNGIISKKSSFQYLDDANINIINNRIYGTSGRINFAVEKTDFFYKFDFGKGNITNHSPVESDYYAVFDKNQEPEWHLEDYNYRIPIKINNTKSYNLENVSIKINLDQSNFDYSKVDVNNINPKQIETDFVFYDPSDPILNERPYFIDYWNPEGESLIYLNASIEKLKTKYIYLYYGSNINKQHSINDVSLFFDDFNTLDNWVSFGSSIHDGKAIIEFGESITSNTFLIPKLNDPDPLPGSVNISESMYIVELKNKIENNAQNIITLLKDGGIDSYKIYLNHSSLSEISINKKGTSDNHIKNVFISKLNEWLRTKNYIYIGKYIYGANVFTNVTLINTNVFNYSFFSCIGNCSVMDTYPDVEDDATGEPYKYGKIMLQGSNGAFSGDVIVDWIRVMKIPISLDVSIGATEIKDNIIYDWSTNSAFHRSNEDFANPVLCDFHTGFGSNTFTIKNLPDGTYTLSFTMGDYSAQCGKTTIKIGGSVMSAIPSTKLGEFKTKWFVYEHSNSGDLSLDIIGNPWTINSLTIQKGLKGIVIKGESIYG